jgi:crotonobetainyl-CoA:carnitine CoA-transferase CaiB-like acyl-CoA transferase
VMTSISNFGQTGPYRDYKASEIVVYAMGGMMYMIGAYDREPLKHGLSQGQYLAAATAATATMAALYGRGEDGVGEHIDVSIMEAIMQGVIMHFGLYAYQGIQLRRQAKVGAIFEACIPTKDGYIAPVFYGYVDWDAFARFMDCPELADPKFSTYAGRIMHSDEFEALLLPKVREWTKEELFHAAQDWRFAFGIVHTPEDTVNCPQLRERGFFVDIDHPEAGRLTYPGAPFKLSENPTHVRCAAPLMGQHNEEVYGRLSLSRQDLVRLREGGVI